MRPRCLLPIALSTLSLAQSFTVQNSNATADLRGLSAAPSGIVWASGTNGTYLRTLDSGTTWVAANVPGAETLDFSAVQAFRENEAYLLSQGRGARSSLLRQRQYLVSNRRPRNSRQRLFRYFLDFLQRPATRSDRRR